MFFDYETIDSGTFEQVILTEIGRRAHFILLLAPGSLDACAKPGDWIMREFEEALRLNRNIVPVLDDIPFTEVERKLLGKLAAA